MSVLRGNNGPRYKHSPDESAPYDTITVDKLTPIIGAEIGGVDLSKPLGNQTFEEIHRALAENLVIFFRDQNLTEEQHLDFAGGERDENRLGLRPTRTRRAPMVKAGTATSRATWNPRWAASCIFASARHAAATRCLRRCMQRMKHCPIE